VVLLLIAATAGAKENDRERERERERERAVTKSPLLGLELGMTREATLDRLGMLEEEEKEALEHHGSDDEGSGSHAGDAGEEVWMFPSDPRYASATVHFGHDGLLEWATVFARAGGKAVRLREFGDVKRARRTGTVYVWTVPPRGTRRGYRIVARSQNLSAVQSWSIMPPGQDPPGRETR
jgi:hypothetical protein